MKTITTILLTTGLLLTAAAEDAVKVEVRFIEHPADMAITKDAWQRGELLKQRGVDVLSAPIATPASGRLASIKVVDQRSVPSGGTPKEGANWERKVETGPELQVLPIVRGDTIEFCGTATIRQFEGVEPIGDVAVSQFTSREFYIGGSTKSGETLVLPSKATGQSRRITLVVTFTKVAIRPSEKLALWVIGWGWFGGDSSGRWRGIQAAPAWGVGSAPGLGRRPWA
jgi:hypothetical protein